MSKCIFNSIAIIGYGKFGRLLYSQLVSSLPSVRFGVYSEPWPAEKNIPVVNFESLNDFDLIIYAAPISELEGVIQKLSNVIRHSVTIVEVCSVKNYPQEILLKYGRDDWNLIGLHPLFGPASYTENKKSLNGLTVTANNIRCEQIKYEAVLKFLSSLYLEVLELTSDDHDKFFGQPQFLTHLAAKLFKQPMESTLSVFEGIRSVDRFRSAMNLLTSDEALLKDFLKYNKYTKESFEYFKKSYQSFMSSLDEK